MKRRTAISLFAGAGGMDIGFKKAGFDIRVCLEIDPSCCETLRTNVGPNTKVIEADVRSILGRDLLAAAKLKRGEVDCLFGGPPCQSFSLAGLRHGLNDERGQLVAEFIRLVHEIQPKTFVLENVKGMATWQNGAVLKYIEDLLRKPADADEYTVDHQVLNAADFGVPQHRHRIFIVGNRLKRQFKWPVKSHGPVKNGVERHVSVSEALEPLPRATPPSATAMRVAETIKGRRERHGY